MFDDIDCPINLHHKKSEKKRGLEKPIISIELYLQNLKLVLEFLEMFPCKSSHETLQFSLSFRQVNIKMMNATKLSVIIVIVFLAIPFSDTCKY